MAVALAASTSFFYGLRGPILGDLTNKLIGSSERATVNSLGAFIQQILYGIYAPILGILSDSFGIIKAIQISVILLSINILLIILYFKFSRQQKT